MIMTQYIERLERISGDVDSWGGKAATLGSLLKYALPVPSGVVLHTHLYEEFERVRDNATARDKFKRELNFAISDSLRELDIEENVMFRSSANIEGSSDLCCSGIFESFSCVRKMDYADTAILVWESTHNPHTTRYLADRTNTKGLKMGVLIQPVCRGEFSGIIQSHDVMQGSRNMVIEYCPWRLEAVVDGMEDSERVVLSETGKIKDGLWRGKRSTLEELYCLGKRIESILGGVVEVEFVADKNQVNILQSRRMKGC